MNLTKYVENLYSENYTMLMKEIKDPKKNGQTYCVYGLKQSTQ